MIAPEDAVVSIFSAPLSGVKRAYAYPFPPISGKPNSLKFGTYFVDGSLVSNEPSVSEENCSDFPFTPAPSASNSLAITITEVFALASDKTSPTIVGLEVSPCTKTFAKDNEPVSTAVSTWEGKRSSHDKVKIEIERIDITLIILE